MIFRHFHQGVLVDEGVMPLPDPSLDDAVADLVHVQAVAFAEATLLDLADHIDPDMTRTLSPLVTPWAPGETVEADALRSHDHDIWQAIQTHTTQDDWTPAESPALWRRWRDKTAPPAPWVQPTGGHDAYALGDRVTHNGATWESLVAGNVWQPSDAVPTLWKKL